MCAFGSGGILARGCGWLDRHSVRLQCVHNGQRATGSTRTRMERERESEREDASLSRVFSSLLQQPREGSTAAGAAAGSAQGSLAQPRSGSAG